ncbi:single-stranded DNA-binding protein [Candidatus Nomurabacteria bacterium]|uniref:Single-stranded DNA-binding protein n=1 Tax=candidate division WWE3 bacterium TaxID=2053526 RepID=A0A955E1S9_UNCKA|nr:single-stranded DNA-binding protein [candidate division WWE3 bacterium]MCB9823675.1 single-stranded DNA-binding protein [Candidatus Nomurabacteria bacterium]MCB9827247.1 single-stranded DNA-binding protein [Candidatus Nomurabacteria bacterium]MCB9827470.1 single-stranded DNA-binding protein [Candidatus Nomurabacteria bacterium]HXK52592.1 single-stranded DNA-binding protein [bacterium]
MTARDVNKVILIGNLTRDPEVRYTPQGTAVANFTIATNRSWSIDGEKKEAVDFHNVVAWNKLAELCGQLLTKGTKVYVEGRLQTRNWVGDDGVKRYRTEINIDEMIVLISKGSLAEEDSYDETHAVGEERSEESVDGVDIDDLLNELEENSVEE